MLFLADRCHCAFFSRTICLVFSTLFQLNYNNRRRRFGAGYLDMKINMEMLKDEYQEFDNSENMDNMFHNILPGPPPYTLSDIDDHILQNIESANFVVLSQDETMDVAKYEPAAEPAPPPPLTEFYPISRYGPPERRVFAGELNFQVEINGLDTHRRKYLYSHKLNRIYVDMGIDFPLQFRWESNPTAGPMFVRATVVFSDEAQQEKRVERCTQHTHDSTNNGVDANIVKNVLRSSRPLGTEGVFYCGLAARADSWFSVVVQFPTAGICGHAYQFVCKNSCCSGINRRATDILFELEDHTGKIYGRQSVGARACSCPKRDMAHAHDELDKGARPGKRQSEPNRKTDSKQAKKIKQEAPSEEVQSGDSEEILALPPLEVVGSRAMAAGLASMLAVMEHDASRRRDHAEKYAPRIAKLKEAIEQYKRPPQ